MRRHLIIGSSGGIGSAVAAHLRALGEEVVGLSRSEHGIDVTQEATIEAAFSTLNGVFDTVFVSTGALVVDGHQPEKTMKALTPEAMLGQFQVNAFGPALILKHVSPLLPRDRRAVFAALSARVGSIGDNEIGGWYSYRTAKAALNQIVHTASIELKRTHKHAICVCLHPGTVRTAFTEKYAANHKTTPPEQAAANLVQVMDGLSVDQSGGFYDYAGSEIVW